MFQCPCGLWIAAELETTRTYESSPVSAIRIYQCHSVYSNDAPTALTCRYESDTDLTRSLLRAVKLRLGSDDITPIPEASICFQIICPILTSFYFIRGFPDSPWLFVVREQECHVWCFKGQRYGHMPQSLKQRPSRKRDSRVTKHHPPNQCIFVSPMQSSQTCQHYAHC